jgi:hypothetical protein
MIAHSPHHKIKPLYRVYVQTKPKNHKYTIDVYASNENEAIDFAIEHAYADLHSVQCESLEILF